MFHLISQSLVMGFHSIQHGVQWFFIQYNKAQWWDSIQYSNKINDVSFNIIELSNGFPSFNYRIEFVVQFNIIKLSDRIPFNTALTSLVFHSIRFSTVMWFHSIQHWVHWSSIQFNKAQWCDSIQYSNEIKNVYSISLSSVGWFNTVSSSLMFHSIRLSTVMWFCSIQDWAHWCSI